MSQDDLRDLGFVTYLARSELAVDFGDLLSRDTSTEDLEDTRTHFKDVRKVNQRADRRVVRRRLTASTALEPVLM